MPSLFDQTFDDPVELDLIEVPKKLHPIQKALAPNSLGFSLPGSYLGVGLGPSAGLLGALRSLFGAPGSLPQELSSLLGIGGGVSLDEVGAVRSWVLKI